MPRCVRYGRPWRRRAHVTVTPPAPHGAVARQVERTLRPEDLDAYAEARAAERPPVNEDWRTVRDLMRAAEVSRSQAYRLIERGVVPFQVFAGVRYIRGKDIAAFTRSRKTID